MAKPLTIIPPTSSVAKLLDPGIGAAALRPVGPPAGGPVHGRAGVQEGPAAPPRPVAPTGEPADIKREFTLTRSADGTLNELLALLQRQTGSRLHSSHLMRALLRAFQHALPEIEREAAALGTLKRPRNASGQEAERDEFEARIAAALLAGLRSSRSFAPGE